MLLHPVHFRNDIKSNKDKSNQNDFISKLDFSGVSLIVIYLGDTCNFNCTYCDRDYIKYEIGSQNFRNSDFENLIEFLKLAIEKAPNLKYISFHGGEPLLYIDKIDAILESIRQNLLDKNIRWAMTTNGSLISKNKWFFEKWGYNLTITLSYDFKFQPLNREVIDLEEISKIIHQTKTWTTFQFVIPSNIKDAFDIHTIASIIDHCRILKCNTVNLIPLRHLRGKSKFKVFVDEMDLKSFSLQFMKFIHTLYVQGINIYIDGNYEKVDKDYLNNHSKLILSPDGFIYPEFDFLEYKIEKYRIGSWKDSIELYRVKNDDDQLLNNCVNCVMRANCGLKYLYKMFEQNPNGNCIEFYKIIDLMVKHLFKLKTQPTLLNWIGYE